jgi:drug/metabolite transporter (DMT)-like permease
LGSLGNVAYYQALAMGGKAAAVTPLTALYPVFTVLLALLILRERLNRVQGAGVVLSVGAMFLFNVGGGSDWVSPWLALALVPLALWGTGALLQKLSTGSASSELATIAFLAGTLPISFLLPLGMPMTWSQPAGTWFLALAVGFTLGLGNVTLVFAYGTGGKASVVTPMAALYSVVTILLAVTILGERLSRREGLGMVLALAAAVALSYETRAVPAVPSASAITKP